MTKIYRVEHRTNPLKGIYDDMDFKHWWRYDPPEIFMRKNFVCGTTSLKDFRKWFHKKHLRKIYQDPFWRVLILQAKVVYKDENQVVFVRKEAKVIGELLPCGTSIYY